MCDVDVKSEYGGGGVNSVLGENEERQRRGAGIERKRSARGGMEREKEIVGERREESREML